MVYILLGIVFYSIAIMLITYASRIIGSNLVTAIANTVGAIIPIILILPMIGKNIGTNGKMGIIASIVAGISITVFGLATNKSVQIYKVALVTPLVFGGMIFLTAILSYFFFKEKLSPLHITGLVVVLVGMAIITYAAATGK